MALAAPPATLESLGPRVTLLRLAHQFGPGEHPTGSRPAEVDLRTRQLLVDGFLLFREEVVFSPSDPEDYRFLNSPPPSRCLLSTLLADQVVTSATETSLPAPPPSVSQAVSPMQYVQAPQHKPQTSQNTMSLLSFFVL